MDGAKREASCQLSFFEMVTCMVPTASVLASLQTFPRGRGLFFFFFFWLHQAYGSSWARDRVEATAVTYTTLVAKSDP